jgi:hypothetical protein
MQTVRVGGIRRPRAGAAIGIVTVRVVTVGVVTVGVVTVGVVTVGSAGGLLVTRAAAEPRIRLTTAIAPVLQSAVGGIRFAAYTITVRSAGGTARGTRLAVTTRLPAQWSVFPANCRSAQLRSAHMACALGDVTRAAKVTMTLQVPVRARIPGGLRIQAVTTAANVVTPSTASAAVPLRPLAISASAPHPPTPSVPVAQASRSAHAGAFRPPQRPLVPPPLASPLVPPRTSRQPTGPSTPAAPGPWLPTMNPKAASAVPVRSAPLILPPGDSGRVAPQVPAGSRDVDGTPPMSLTTAPEVPEGQEPWARALAVVVVAEAAVLWLAASLSLWRRRLLLGRAAGNGVHNIRLVRPAAALLRRVPRLRSQPGGRAAALSRRLRLRR